MKTMVISYNPSNKWYTVVFPNGKTRNYGSLATLLSVITDFYGK